MYIPNQEKVGTIKPFYKGNKELIHKLQQQIDWNNTVIEIKSIGPSHFPMKRTPCGDAYPPGYWFDDDLIKYRIKYCEKCLEKIIKEKEAKK